MFKKILVANRGEIAMRIIRACRELNIATAAIYSEADSTGIYVKKADEAYMVGPGPVKGFLDSQQIVNLALRIGADAIHPGYGFLSENSQFAQLCHISGITFIGPSPQAIDLMGSKIKARELAKRVGVPIVPGTEGGISNIKDALLFAKNTGYPVIIKASAGGGGRGLRVVRSDTELRENMAVASREAHAAFGDQHVQWNEILQYGRRAQGAFLFAQRVSRIGYDRVGRVFRQSVFASLGTQLLEFRQQAVAVNCARQCRSRLLKLLEPLSGLPRRRLEQMMIPVGRQQGRLHDDAL